MMVFWRLAPSAAATSTASSKGGKARNVSVIRIRASSIQPPR